MKFKDYITEKETYKEFFAKVLAKYKVEDPTELSVEDQEKFYAEVEAGWNSDDEEGKDGVNEGSLSFKQEDQIDNAVKKLVQSLNKEINSALGGPLGDDLKSAKKYALEAIKKELK